VTIGRKFAPTFYYASQLRFRSSQYFWFNVYYSGPTSLLIIYIYRQSLHLFWPLIWIL